jgi:hypothetical protein
MKDIYIGTLKYNINPKLRRLYLFIITGIIFPLPDEDYADAQ